MRNLLLITSLILTSIFINAQTNQCGTDEMHQKLYFGFPGIHQKIIDNNSELEKFTENFIKNPSTNKQTINYVIPVVFHVVHNYGVENISNEQILDGLRIINENFQKRNADTINVVPAFQPIIADCEIEFRLAQLDPNGNCTSGITRTAHTSTLVGDHSVKDVIHWDPDKYLNIYVCAQAAGLAGHALVPSAADTIPEWDGIVMAHGSVGSIGTASPTTSVVLTHEIGHYFNLQHMWGGNNVPNYPYLPVADPGNCSFDDGVSDTPNTIGWQTCSLNGQSCGDLDNIQNFMEYAYCPVMFTEGQKLRMHASLNSSIANRNNLWTTSNLIATGTDGANYFCAADYISDKTKICVGETIQFTDMSFNGIDSWTWEFEGGTPSVSNDTNPVVIYNTPGIYQVKLIAGSGIELDSLITTNMIEVFENTGLQEYMTYDFEGNYSFENSMWYANNPDGQIEWEIDSTQGHNSNRCAKLNNFDNATQQTDELVSRPFNLSNATSISMSFDYAFSRKTNSDLDKLLVLASNDCGLTWDVRKTLVSTLLISNADTVITPFTPNGTEEWKSTVITNITSGYWVDNFMVKFKFESGGGNNIYLDNINILDPSMTDINLSTSFSFNMYPNPAKETLMIQSSKNMNSVQIIDLTGKVINKIDIKSEVKNNAIVNLEGISNGLYLVSINDENGNNSTKKIIISK